MRAIRVRTTAPIFLLNAVLSQIWLLLFGIIVTTRTERSDFPDGLNYVVVNSSGISCRSDNSSDNQSQGRDPLRGARNDSASLLLPASRALFKVFPCKRRHAVEPLPFKILSKPICGRLMKLLC